MTFWDFLDRHMIFAFLAAPAALIFLPMCLIDLSGNIALALAARRKP